LHCIRNAVKAGDRAILRTLEGATNVISKNMDMLMQHYSSVTNDRVEENKASLKAMQEEVTKISSKTFLEEAHEAKGRFFEMFTEMKGMLSGPLHPAGRATVIRALDTFSKHFSGLSLNTTKVMDDMFAGTTVLRSTVQSASAIQLSRVGQVADDTANAVIIMNERLQTHIASLGVSRSLSLEKKKAQAKLGHASASISNLQDALQKQAVHSLLLDLDRSWWAIREKLDAYMDAAENQVATFGEASRMLEDYTTKCSVDIHALNSVHVKASRADDAAKKQLQDTWHTMESEIGLLSSRIVDSNAFLELGRLDVASMDMEANLSAICQIGISGKKAALEAVETALLQGLAQQTWEQFHGVVVDNLVIRRRIEESGLPYPSSKIVLQATDRTGSEFVDDEWRRTIADEVVARLCHLKTPSGQLRAQIVELHEEIANMSNLATHTVELRSKTAEVRSKQIARILEGMSHQKGKSVNLMPGISFLLLTIFGCICRSLAYV